MDDHDYDSAQMDYDAKVAEEAINEFKLELLQNYLIRTAGLVGRPRFMLDEASRLVLLSPTAAFLLAAICSEVCVKKLLLEPMVHGVINQEYAAKLVSELVLGGHGFDRFRELFHQILKTESGIDLGVFRRLSCEKPILDEFRDIMKKRNGIAHRADTATEVEASHAIAVARELLDGVFPRLLDRFHLCLHKGEVIYKSVHNARN